MVCGLCKAEIAATYYRVRTITVCPACVEQEKIREVNARGRYLIRGIGYAAFAAVVGSFLLWGILDFSEFSEVGGMFLRGTAVVLLGKLIGGSAMAGAKNRGSHALQSAAAVLTYLAYSTALVLAILERAPGKHTIAVISVLIAMGPSIPFVMLSKNFMAITGLVTVGFACMLAAGATQRVEPPEGPFDLKDPSSERPMFRPLS
jgi:hypothetical protein